MATNYIKVRPYVARRLGVLESRFRYADGNVQLWEKDLTKVDPGWVFRRDETVARIGGLLMDPYRNREEQQKAAADCTPLPWPTDPMWTDPEATEATRDGMDGEDGEGEGSVAEAEEPASEDNDDPMASTDMEEGGES